MKTNLLQKNIPKNWQRVSFGDVAKLRKGLTYKSSNYSDKDNGMVFLTLKSILRGGGFNKAGIKYYFGKYDNTAVLKQGDLIIANTDITRDAEVVGAPVFVPFLSEKPVLMSMDLSAIDVDEEKINKLFFYYLLQEKRARNFMKNQASGSTVLHLKTSNVPKFEFQLPTLVEQEKIAHILYAVDDEINKVDELISLTKKIKSGLINNLFNFKNKNDIKLMALGELGKVSMCKRIFKDQTSSTGDIPFYKIGTFGKKADAFISQELFDTYREKFSFPKVGDVLLSASGTIGRKVKYDGEPAYFQDSNIIWLEHDESKVLNDFLFYLYETVKWETSGSTIKRLYNNAFIKKVVPVPPIDLQRKIVDVLSTADQKILMNSDLKEKLMVLKKGLMSDLLSGKVRTI